MNRLVLIHSTCMQPLNKDAQNETLMWPSSVKLCTSFCAVKVKHSTVEQEEKCFKWRTVDLKKLNITERSLGRISKQSLPFCRDMAQFCTTTTTSALLPCSGMHYPLTSATLTPYPCSYLNSKLTFSNLLTPPDLPIPFLFLIQLIVYCIYLIVRCP